MITTHVTMDCRKLRDWPSFHDEFSRVFGFPAFYGKNMDAWIDCMTSLDTPEDGMTSVHCEVEKVLIIELDNADEFKRQSPEQYAALIRSVECVNDRRSKVGEASVLALHLKP